MLLNGALAHVGLAHLNKLGKLAMPGIGRYLAIQEANGSLARLKGLLLLAEDGAAFLGPVGGPTLRMGAGAIVKGYLLILMAHYINKKAVSTTVKPTIQVFKNSTTSR